MEATLTHNVNEPEIEETREAQESSPLSFTKIKVERSGDENAGIMIADVTTV